MRPLRVDLVRSPSGRRAYFSLGKPIKEICRELHLSRKVVCRSGSIVRSPRPALRLSSISSEIMPTNASTGKISAFTAERQPPRLVRGQSLIERECRLVGHWRGSLTKDGAFAGRQLCAAPIVSALTAPRRPRGLSGPTVESFAV